MPFTIRLFAPCIGLMVGAFAQDLFLGSKVASHEQAKQDRCSKNPEVVSTTVANQGKFAVWHSMLEALLWVDSPAFTPAWAGSIVYAFKPSDNKTYTVIRFDTSIVGSVMPRKGGGIVLAISKPQGKGYISSFETMDIDATTFQGTNLVHLATLPQDTKGKFNNGNCDPAGRFWAGSFDYGHETEVQGKVWVLQRKGAGYDVSVGIDKLSHPNGLIWNQNGTELLFSETYRNVVYKYEYSLVDGKVIGSPRPIVSASSGELLDSMCGLRDGSFYVTEPSSGQLRYYSSEGVSKCVLPVPGISSSNFVASCAFSHDDALYLPTGRNGGGSGGPAGWLFRVSGVTGGIAPTLCDV